MIEPHAHAGRKPVVPTLDEYHRLHRLSLDAPEVFWAQRAEETVSWFHKWHNVFDSDYEETDMGWFLGGRLNACYNCVDRHVVERGDRTAIIWAKDEPGDYEHITYRQLKHHVARVANVLKHHGVRKGDRVIVYLPMIPDLAYVMLACARIGAVHSVVFARLQRRGAARPRARLGGEDRHHRQRGAARRAHPAPEGDRRPRRRRPVARWSACWWRGGPPRTSPCGSVVTSGSTRRCRKQRSTCSVEWMGAEEPLFILYTSGSTGKPKGVMHTTAGYLVYAAYTHKAVFDYQNGDIYFCAADLGWITGHTYIIYGPLCNGATTVMFESTPVYPDAGRYWQHRRRPRREHLLHGADGHPRPQPRGRRVRDAVTAATPCAPSAPSANRSARTPGCGTTTSSAAAAATSSTPGGRPRPAASSSRRCPA